MKKPDFIIIAPKDEIGFLQSKDVHITFPGDLVDEYCYGLMMQVWREVNFIKQLHDPHCHVRSFEDILSFPWAIEPVLFSNGLEFLEERDMNFFKEIAYAPMSQRYRCFESLRKHFYSVDYDQLEDANGEEVDPESISLYFEYIKYAVKDLEENIDNPLVDIIAPIFGYKEKHENTFFENDEDYVDLFYVPKKTLVHVYDMGLDDMCWYELDEYGDFYELKADDYLGFDGGTIVRDESVLRESVFTDDDFEEYFYNNITEEEELTDMGKSIDDLLAELDQSEKNFEGKEETVTKKKTEQEVLDELVRNSSVLFEEKVETNDEFDFTDEEYLRQYPEGTVTKKKTEQEVLDELVRSAAILFEEKVETNDEFDFTDEEYLRQYPEDFE